MNGKLPISSASLLRAACPEGYLNIALSAFRVEEPGYWIAEIVDIMPGKKEIGGIKHLNASLVWLTSESNL
jgi:hypothetical protein